MPLTRTIGNYFDSSSSFLRRVERWTGPTSYVTGGEACPASTFGLGTIVKGINGVASNGIDTRLVWWNPSTEKLQWFVPSTNVEVANNTDLSAYSIQYDVIGT
jgi:hypothetical protein